MWKNLEKPGKNLENPGILCEDRNAKSHGIMENSSKDYMWHYKNRKKFACGGHVLNDLETFFFNSKKHFIFYKFCSIILVLFDFLFCLPNTNYIGLNLTELDFFYSKSLMILIKLATPGTINPVHLFDCFWKNTILSVNSTKNKLQKIVAFSWLVPSWKQNKNIFLVSIHHCTIYIYSLKELEYKDQNIDVFQSSI